VFVNMSTVNARADLNADVGESFGAYSLGQDPALMRVITSASVACGFHAGDPGIMRATVALAKRHGVAVGAHPSFPDLQGFGRRAMSMTAREVEDLALYQIGALAAIAAAEGLRLQHVKAHGALYNMAAQDRRLADALARAAATFDANIVFFGLAGSELVAAGERAKLRTAREGFADRAYRSDGSLVPRDQPGAVIHDADVVAARAVRMIREREVETIDGQRLAIHADTICLHGDTPGAAAIAARIRGALETAGVVVMPIAQALGRSGT
jgi:UPF0271 protein